MWFDHPTVRVIAHSAILPDAIDAWLADHDLDWDTDADDDAGAITEFAGRLCYMAFGAAQGTHGNTDYLANILAHGHGSVLEHATITFVVEGVSRGCTHEWVRHRAGTAYSQLSTRFVDQAHVGFVTPPLILRYPDLREAWEQDMLAATQAYERRARALEAALPYDLGRRQRRKLIRECARGVLPHDLETKLVFTTNYRELRHILALRGAMDALVEFRRVCAALYLAALPTGAACLADLALDTAPDGWPVITATHHKV